MLDLLGFKTAIFLDRLAMPLGSNKMLLSTSTWYKELPSSSTATKLLGTREIEIMVKSPGDPGLYSVDESTRKFQAWASHPSSHSCLDLFGVNMIFLVQSRIRVLSLLEALEFLSVGSTRDL